MVKIRKAWDLALANHRAVVVALCIVVLIAGVGYSVLLGDSLRYYDEQEYLDIADGIAAHARFELGGEPTAFRPPAYPAVLAGLRWLGAPIVVLRILNYVALSAAIFLLYRALLRVRGAGEALLAAAFLSFYPLVFYAAGTLYPQLLAMAGLALLIDLLARVEREGRLSQGRASAVGLLLAFLILLIPSFVFALVLILPWLFWVQPGRMKSIALAGILCVALVGSWSLRNAVALDAFVPISTNSGLNLLLGNSPATMPGSGVNVDISAFREEAEGLSEAERDAYFRDAALAHIKENKLDTAWLYAGKVGHHFHFRNRLATASESASWHDWLLLATYGPLLAFALMYCLRGRSFPLARVELLLVALYLGSAFFYALFFTRLRFRVPFELALVWLAAAGISQLLPALGFGASKPSSRGSQQA